MVVNESTAYSARRRMRWHSPEVGLTVKLRGRVEAPAHGAEGAQSLGARGADPEAHHGPLQRLLGLLPLLMLRKFLVSLRDHRQKLTKFCTDLTIFLRE